MSLVFKNCIFKVPLASNLLKNSLSTTTNGAVWEEIRIPVPWGHIAGKWWGPTDQRPVLTFHGWQDNCGSFNRLIPLLNKNVSFLTIDWPGHGLSSRLPSGMYYTHLDYLVTIQFIRRYFGWPKVSLMAHSLGAICSFVHTSLHPHEVDLLIGIDAIKPFVIKNSLQQMHEHLTAFMKFEQQERSHLEPPSFTLDEIKKKVCAPNHGSVMYEHSHHLLERGIAPSKHHPDKYYLTRDPRLKAGELIMWPQKHSVKGAHEIVCPVLFVKATEASYYEDKRNLYEVLDVLRKRLGAECRYHRLQGTHHIHLNSPEVMEGVVNDFLAKHYVGDRAHGGLKSEMRVAV